MDSLRIWWRKVWAWIAARFSRLDEIESFIQATSNAYLDPALWARIRHISPEEAASQLEAGVKLGYLEKCWLYAWPDAPGRFLVPLDHIGRTVSLADVGFFGQDGHQQVTISRYHVREVYVSAAGGE